MAVAEAKTDAKTLVADRRGNAFRLDPAAFTRNVGRARALLRDEQRLLQVIKGDGYGIGIERTVRLGLDASVDGFCVGTPEEAVAAVAVAGGKPVVLFTACLPTELPILAQAGVIVTVNAKEALDAIGSASTAGYLLELDCGFGRFGFNERALEAALDHGLGLDCLGAYTHFGSQSFDQLGQGLERFDAMLRTLRGRLGRDMMTMAAASHAMIWRPALDYSAADPGSLLYGLLPKAMVPAFEPVVTQVTASLLQINRVHDHQQLSIGYGTAVDLAPGGRTGVFGLGWIDGLSNRAFGTVLVSGQRAPVIGRTLLHSIVDLSAVPGEVAVGDEVVLVGRQRDSAIDLEEAAAGLDMSPTQFHFQVLGAIGRTSGAGA